MQSDINYEPKNEVVVGTNLSPITTSEVAVIDIKDDGTNFEQLKKLRGNSQASLRFNYVHGSLTNVNIKIYFYTNLGGTFVPFQRTSSDVLTGVDTISPYEAQLGTTDFAVDIDFPLMACDGIKITITGVGTDTGSSTTNLHLALRTN